MLDKGIQFGEGIERIMEPMAFEQRYLTAVTVLSMGKRILSRGNSNCKAPR